MSPVWRSIARAGAVELLLVAVIFSSPLVFTRPDLLPYTIPLATVYIIVVAVLSFWCWRSIRKMDEARAAEYRRRLALAEFQSVAEQRAK